MKADIYQELYRDKLYVNSCEKESLRGVLEQEGEKLDLKKDDLIFQICENDYKIYRESTHSSSAKIELDTAMKYRLELDLNDLDQAVSRIDDDLKNYPFIYMTDKYCVVRHMDTTENFYILDVYVGIRQAGEPVLI